MSEDGPESDLAARILLLYYPPMLRNQLLLLLIFFFFVLQNPDRTVTCALIQAALQVAPKPIETPMY
jgi:hypothetical protein